MREVKRKILVVVLLAGIMLATPIVAAMPGQQDKNNEKFEDFALLVSGAADDDPDRYWWTPPNVDEADLKTAHTREMGWVTGATVELTVGGETFTTATTDISVEYTTSFDMDRVVVNGVPKRWNIRLTDVVTVLDDGTPIGELILELKSTIVPGRDPVYYGNVVGRGTGALKGVHISAVDLGLVSIPPPALYERVGTITGWPDAITNT